MVVMLQSRRSSRSLLLCFIFDCLSVCSFLTDCISHKLHQVTEIIGSLTFVRNWHGFGLGQLRSQVTICSGHSCVSAHSDVKVPCAHL
jgi:hypothetical protein